MMILANVKRNVAITAVLLVALQTGCYQAKDNSDGGQSADKATDIYNSDGGQSADKATDISGLNGKWTKTTSFPITITGHAVVSLGTYVYVIGGVVKSGSPPTGNPDVYYTKVDSNGAVTTPWTKTSSPGGNWHNLDAVVVDYWIYAAGGSNGYGALSKVMYSKIDTSTGQLGAWHSTVSLPEGLENTGLVSWMGYVYAVGGRSKSCYQAKWSKYGGLDSWKACTNLPNKESNQNGAVSYKDQIYYYGSENNNKLYSTKVNSSGALGTWSTYSVPFSINGPLVFVANDHLFMAGGGKTAGPTADVWFARILSDGKVGKWYSFAPMPDARSSHDGAVTSGGALVLVGGTAKGMSGYAGDDTVYSLKITIH